MSQTRLLLACMLCSGFCGILSELSLFNLGSILLGGTNQTLLYTMGVMMFFMGVGSLLTESSWFRDLTFDHFAWVEIFLSLLCAASVPLIYYLSGLMPDLSLSLIIVFSASIGTLIGMEIPMVLRLNEKLGLMLSTNSARVMMADYFGSLLAFILFPFVLLPFLGLHYAAILGGSLNFFLALLTLFTFRIFLRRKQLITGALGLCALCLGSLFLSADHWKTKAEDYLFRDPVILQKDTPYQNLVFTAKNPLDQTPYHQKNIMEENLFKKGPYTLSKMDGRFEEDIRFFINGGLQFSTIDEYRYHETMVHPLFFLRPDAQEVLILGGGDGLLVREVLKYPQVQKIVLVDLDSELTNLFRETELARLNQYALRDKKATIINQDAFHFLRYNKTVFPLILIDFPDPHSIDTAKLYSLQFFQMLRKSLEPQGYYSIQSASPLFTPQVFMSIHKTLKAADLNPLPLHINMKTFEEWGFQLGSPKVSPERIKADLMAFTPTVKTKYLNRDAMQAATLFARDALVPIDLVPVNDLLYLPLPGLYEKH